MWYYEIEGTAAGGQTWKTEGRVELETPSVDMVFLVAMRESFAQLTKGQAVYGSPGVGCVGPYKFTRLELRRGVGE